LIKSVDFWLLHMIKLRQSNEHVKKRALENVWNSKPKGSCCFSYSVFISKMSKSKKIYLLVPNNQSISDEENDNNSDYKIHDDEDQDISEKEDIGKEDDEDKKNDSFYFCNKKIKTTERLLQSKLHCSTSVFQ